jgi:Ca2+-dependent lipid-binding protein
MDPYVRMSIGEKKFETKVAKDQGKAPKWGESFKFALKTD